MDYSFSYYPLYPPAEEVNMDYEKFQQFSQMNLTPDILVVPSELRYFIKVHQSHFRIKCYYICIK